MEPKTFRTAVVLIPPEDLWPPIQAIRKAHDRQVRRWMPHITLLYPFRPREDFDTATILIEKACRSVRPLEVWLAELRHFRHGRRGCTMWLAPEPTRPLVELQAALQAAFPDCDDVSRHAQGFTPHLSLGQTATRRVGSLLATLGRSWQTVSFVADGVSLIWREDPPDDVFRVDRTIPLGPELPT
jgi:2'-5' RNA ligase